MLAIVWDSGIVARLAIVTEPIWERLAELPFTGDQLVCLGHDQAAWSVPPGRCLGNRAAFFESPCLQRRVIANPLRQAKPLPKIKAHASSQSFAIFQWVLPLPTRKALVIEN